MKKRNVKTVALAFMPVAVIMLAGCWTPPNANVQPAGEPRLIQSGIIVESVKDPATVQAVDAGARTMTLKLSDNTTATYKVGASVDNLGQVQVGNAVEATVAEDLAVYLLAKGRLLNGTTAESLGVNARVLLVDPSYRLLTLQYPNGHAETFKPGLGVLMEQMAPGDSVVVTPREVTKIRIEKP
ncbi:MAG: hypothetical protein ACLQAH_04590 [Limisphaerales bacterium]